MLALSPDIVVVGTARSGRQALAAFASAQPDVICTDYQMPEMDGLALVRQTMATFPRPILVVSSLLDPAKRDQIFPLLAAGAVDVLAKPDANTPFEQSAATLIQKIKLLSKVVVISRRLPSALGVKGAQNEIFPAQTPENGAGASRPWPAPQNLEASRRASPQVSPVIGALPPGEARHESGVAGAILRPYQAHPVRVVAIGASTGGPQTLQTLFSRLKRLSCPILCVQHISSGFLQGLVDWLDGQSQARVKIAEPGEVAAPGTIYFPPENTHLEIDEQGRLIHSHQPPLGGHKPAVTVTFESLARSYGRGALGVLLTGMGSDGAAGLEAIMLAGGATMAQNEASCVVFGMPKQAISRGAAHFVLAPEQIADKIEQLASPISG